MPLTVVRCAATVPAAIRPAAIVDISRSDRDLATRLQVVELETDRVGDGSQRRSEAVPAVVESTG